VNIHESLLVQGFARSSRGAISMPWFVVNNISQNSAPQKKWIRYHGPMYQLKLQEDAAYPIKMGS
jgi:hypothetical protein